MFKWKKKKKSLIWFVRSKMSLQTFSTFQSGSSAYYLIMTDNAVKGALAYGDR